MKISTFEDFFLIFAGNIFSNEGQKSETAKLIEKKGNWFDWNYVLKNAEKNEIIPQLYYLIKSIKTKIDIPMRFLKNLETLYNKSISYNLVSKYTLEEVSKLFLKHRLKFLLVKGHAIAKFFPNYSHRSFGDIDILIPSYRAYQKAIKLLLLNGYSVLSQSYPKGEMWTHLIKKGRFSVDLHRELQWGKYRVLINSSKLFSNAVEANLNNQTVFFTSPEDSIVINSARLHDNGSFIIRDLVDVKVILNKLKANFNWEYLLKSTEDNGLTQTALSLLYLVDRMYMDNLVPKKIIYKLRKGFLSKFLFSLLEKTELKLPLLKYSYLSKVIFMLGLPKRFKRDLQFFITRGYRSGFVLETLRFLSKKITG